MKLTEQVVFWQFFSIFKLTQCHELRPLMVKISIVLIYTIHIFPGDSDRLQI